MMANIQKCVAATEASNDALLLIVNKGLGYPKKGTHVGGGIHVALPATYDGTGACPPGWTKQPTANYVNTPLDSALPIDDATAALLQGAPAQALLSGAEQVTLAAALATRASKDLESAAYIPKADSAVVAQAIAAEQEAKP